jgi:hypothetical protein
LPVGEARLVPAIIRAAAAVALTPFAATQLHAVAVAAPTHGEIGLVLAAVGGAATGLAASAITATAAAAGALVDQTVSGGPGGAAGDHGGPISFLFSLAAGLIMCQTGSLGSLMAHVARAPIAHVWHLAALTGIPRIATTAALTMALPMLCAHATATIVAAFTARLGPRINGMLLAPALSTPVSLIVMLAGAGSVFAWMRYLSGIAADVARR